MTMQVRYGYAIRKLPSVVYSPVMGQTFPFFETGRRRGRTHRERRGREATARPHLCGGQ